MITNLINLQKNQLVGQKEERNVMWEAFKENTDILKEEMHKLHQEMNDARGEQLEDQRLMVSEFESLRHLVNTSESN